MHAQIFNDRGICGPLTNFLIYSAPQIVPKSEERAMRTILCSFAIAVLFVNAAAAQSLSAKTDIKAPAPRLPNGKRTSAESGRDPERRI
jgi:hypothetical protein